MNFEQISHSTTIKYLCPAELTLPTLQEIPKQIFSNVLQKITCAVCGIQAHGIHFGVHTCAACGAFFRRSVADKRAYLCLSRTYNCKIIHGRRRELLRWPKKYEQLIWIINFPYIMIVAISNILLLLLWSCSNGLCVRSQSTKAVQGRSGTNHNELKTVDCRRSIAFPLILSFSLLTGCYRIIILVLFSLWFI